MSEIKDQNLDSVPVEKFGYKGLSKDMISTNSLAKKETFEIGVIYSKNTDKEPDTCSGWGYHYCDDLENVFTYYPRNGSNRFFKVQILGPSTTDKKGDKSATTSLKIIEELSEEFWKDWDAKAVIRKKEKEELLIEDNLNLDAVRIFQQEYPQFHVGGSVGLFLHGFRLKRWLKSSSSDIDMIAPYFILPETFIPKPKEEDDHKIDLLSTLSSSTTLINKTDFDVDEFRVTYLDAKASNNDFDETFLLEIDGQVIKIDYKVDPKQRYEFITYKGFKYKVSPFWTIFSAKMRYAEKGAPGVKHKEDIEELLNYKKK